MHKKFIIPIIIAVVLAIAAGVGIWWLINNKKSENGGKETKKNCEQ